MKMLTDRRRSNWYTEDPGSKKLVFNTDYRLMQVKNIEECFLQYFRPSLSYRFPFRPLFYLFLSGRLRHFTVPIGIHSAQVS